MKLSVHFAGKVLILTVVLMLFLLWPRSNAYALHGEFKDGNFVYPTLTYVGATTAFYFISQFENGPLIFSALYGMSSMYLLREVYQEQQYAEDLVVPVSMMTMAVANAALFSDEDEFSDHDVFIYNWVAATAIAAYGIWEHSQRKTRPRVMIRPNGLGFIARAEF